MDSIQVQASKLWDLLFAKETAETYQTTLNLTGTILKETAQLLWLIICSAFVFGAWFSDTTVKSGKSIRDWVDQKANPSAVSADQTSLADTGKSLLDTGRVGVAKLLNQAREQLGIDPEELPAVERTIQAVKPTPEPAPAKATPAPAPAANKPAPSAPPASQPPTVKPFDKGAGSAPAEGADGPSSTAVGSSRGAGSQSFTAPVNEITREDAPDDGWSPDQVD